MPRLNEPAIGDKLVRMGPVPWVPLDSGMHDPDGAVIYREGPSIGAVGVGKGNARTTPSDAVCWGEETECFLDDGGGVGKLVDLFGVFPDLCCDGRGIGAKDLFVFLADLDEGLRVFGEEVEAVDDCHGS